jgi:HEPN domain-containing protein
LTKQEHIIYWRDTAEKDWGAVRDMFKTRNYVHALFWAHMVLEKLLKAHWVKDNIGNHPPKIHNLPMLAQKTKLSLNNNYLIFLDKMNNLQLEGRYPDYINNIYKIYKRKQTASILEEVEKIRECLLRDLP